MLTLATWNVNSIRARLDLLEWFLRERSPDVLCLQETKVDDGKFPEELFGRFGYEVAHWGFSAWNGVAIAARAPMERVQMGLAGDQVGEARAIAATIAGVRVFSLYIPNGRALDDPHYAYKLEWLSHLLASVRGESAPVILAGDFNVAPADGDVYDPEALAGATHVSPPERMAIAMLVEAGLVDCGAGSEPGSTRFTWWDYRQGAFRRDMGMRIDLVLASPSLLQPSVRYRVDAEARGAPKPSDHAPVLVSFGGWCGG